MSLIRLQIGSIIPEEANEAPEVVPSVLERRALLVYTGTFQSMDGQVEVKDEHIERLAANHNTLLKKIMTRLAGELPAKFYPPIQLDHSLSAKDTIGRLVGLVEVGEYTEDNQTMKALYGRVRIIGKENVEKVLDGRWTHLSIGADLEDGKFQEVTVTPFPAAANASLMSRGPTSLSQAEYRALFEKAVNSVPGVRPTKVDVSESGARAYYGDEGRAKAAKDALEKVSGLKSLEMKQESDNLWVLECKFSPVNGVKLNEGDAMLEKLKSYLTGFKKLSAEDAEKKLAEMPDDEKKKLMTEAEAAQAKRDRMKGYLMAVKGMDEESAEKHLTEVSQEDLKKLEAEVDEHEKLAAKNADTEKMSTEEQTESDKAKMMKESQEKLAKLSQGMGARLASIKLAAKESKIISRLSGLKASMKITPAEIKKIDIKRLAKENDATIEAVLSSYESREPVVFAGIIGTTQTINMAAAEKARLAKEMEKDILASMPFTSRLRKSSLAEGEQEGAADKVEIHVDTDPHTDLMTEYNELCKMMDEGKLDEVKAKLKKRYMGGLASYGAAVQEDAGATHERMSMLEQELVKLQNEYEEMVKLTASMRE